MAKKTKFDLSHLVQSGLIRDGEKVFFVSDPNKSGAIKKQPNGDFKLDLEGEALSIHAAAQKFLGQEPPTHASQWLRNNNGKTLFQLWQSQVEEAYD